MSKKTRLKFPARANAWLRLLTRVVTRQVFQHGPRSVSIMCLIHILFSLIQRLILVPLLVLYSSLFNLTSRVFIWFLSNFNSTQHIMRHTVFIQELRFKPQQTSMKKKAWCRRCTATYFLRACGYFVINLRVCSELRSPFFLFVLKQYKDIASLVHLSRYFESETIIIHQHLNARFSNLSFDITGLP